ncbi:GGDEF domain-containing protein [Thiomicrorhabdus sediminis]|uniref:diguanylate cyclase n=1 Tax=Thiomicrorhabdus sediminis TaxID=2580412 RepID=A0A4P9K788_9GAMM|nr:GGDEF domain-containing protein [Thiomicrorhabdus sediminis]QCU90945.1 diguanylate cyclase [Thiomicrorhabdus sediminis]
MKESADLETAKPIWARALDTSIEDPRRYSRLLLANALLLVGVLLNAFLATLNLFTSPGSYGFVMHIIAFFVFIGLMLLLRKKQNLVMIGHITAVITVCGYAMLLGYSSYQYDLIFLAPLIPFILFLLNGNRAGVLYFAIWLVLIMPIAFQGVGRWYGGEWHYDDIVRLLLISLISAGVAFLVEFSRCISAKRENHRRNAQQLCMQELRNMSRTDALTGLYNRHYFNEVIDDFVLQSQNQEKQMTFFLLDIDDFKFYNDTYGHQQGDEALQLVGKTIKDYVKRENDLVFRLGGEEFGGLVSGRDSDNIEKWLVGLVKEIENLNLRSANESEHPFVTVSMGISSSQVATRADFDRLYKAADDGMYLAKQHGRNCAVKYNGSDLVEILAS